MNTFDTLQNTYDFFLNFYNSLKKTSSHSELEIIQISQISSFYFGFKEKLIKTINFDIDIKFNNDDPIFFNINDLIQINHLTNNNKIIFSSQKTSVITSLSLSGQVDCYQEGNIISSNSYFKVKEAYSFFMNQHMKKETDMGVLVYSNHFNILLNECIREILKENQSKINNIYSTINNTSILFSEILHKTSNYINNPKNSAIGSLTNDMILKSNIDFSQILPIYFDKKFTKNNYITAIRDFIDHLTLMHDIQINNKLTTKFLKKIKHI